MLRCLVMILLAFVLVSCGEEQSQASVNEGKTEASIAGNAKKSLSPELLDRIDPYRGLFEDISTDEALVKAADESRLLVIYYHNDGCEHCRLFEEEVLASAEVQDWLKVNAVLIRNRTPNEAQRMFQRYSDGLGLPFPSVILLRSNGDRLRVVRPDVKNHISVEDLMRNLKEVRGLSR